MRVLIVEDDFTSRRVLQGILSPYGDCDIAVDGREAVTAFRVAEEEDEPYDLICLDIMMPKMDGQEALKEIREMETQKEIRGLGRTKVIMTTAVSDPDSVLEAFREQCEAYLLKPIDREELLGLIRSLGLTG